MLKTSFYQDLENAPIKFVLRVFLLTRKTYDLNINGTQIDDLCKLMTICIVKEKIKYKKYIFITRK